MQNGVVMPLFLGIGIAAVIGDQLGFSDGLTMALALVLVVVAYSL